MLRARRHVFGLLAVLAGLLGAVPRAGAADRVGSDTCKSCHAAAYESWRASAHAKAAEALSPAQQQDVRCIHCHAPDLARAVQESAAFQGDRSLATAELGVGCEACHGAGQYYSASYVMRDAELARAVGLTDPGQKSCLACHTADAPSLTPFDFAAKVQLIDHWSNTPPGPKASDRHAPRAQASGSAPAEALACGSSR